MTVTPAAVSYCPILATPGCIRKRVGFSRITCSGCGTRLAVRNVFFGVFTWVETGRYPAADAHSLHRSERFAQTAAGRHPDRVVREIPAGEPVVSPACVKCHDGTG